ncbi:MAG TPA: hypothetical protein VHV77_01935, partial [Pirellulales bacterium]|nr:hypothetical protein [Pirellulales bacterium]
MTSSIAALSRLRVFAGGLVIILAATTLQAQQNPERGRGRGGFGGPGGRGGPGGTDLLQLLNNGDVQTELNLNFSQIASVSKL